MKSNEDIVRCRWRLQIFDHRIERCILTFGWAKIKWSASDQRHGHRRLGFVPSSPVCVSSHRIPGKSPLIGASVPTRLITWDFEDLDIKLDGYFDRCTRRAWGERCQRFALLLQYVKLMIHSPLFAIRQMGDTFSPSCCNTSNCLLQANVIYVIYACSKHKRQIRHICIYVCSKHTKHTRGTLGSLLSPELQTIKFVGLNLLIETFVGFKYLNVVKYCAEN